MPTVCIRARGRVDNPPGRIASDGGTPGPTGGAAIRALDLVLSLAGLVALAPLMLAIAAWVRADTPGPVVYRQVRVGRGERTFRLLKFRSMVVDADRIGSHMTRSGDPRVTRSGAFLRRTSLDELPQLLNVLRGDMSLVGPRPDLPRQLAELDPDVRRRRCSVRPGLTGLAQVDGRHGLTPTERLARDLEYVDRRSLWLNIRILGRTVSELARSRSF